MTVPAANDRIAGPFTATGGETVLAYDFRILDQSDLAVWRRRSEADLRLALGVDYTVTGVGAANGGSVLLTAAAVAGDQYIVEGARPQGRSTDLVYARALPAPTMNAELDSLQMQLVELKEKIERAILRSRFDGPAATPLELPPFKANTLIGFGDDAALQLFDRDQDGSVVITAGDLDFAIKDRDLSAPPGSPAVGDQYLVKPAGSGAWAGKTGKMRWSGIGWTNTINKRGQLHWIEDENAIFAWDGAILKEVTGRGQRDLKLVDFGLDEGNSAATNTTAVNAAIARAAELGGARLIAPRGLFQCNAWNPIASNSTMVQGVERFTGGTEFRFNNVSGDCITLNEKGHLAVRDLYLTTNVKRTGGAAVKVGASAFAARIERVRADYHWNGFDIGASAQTRILDCVQRYQLGTFGTRALGAAGAGIYGLTLRDITTDNPYVHPLGAYLGDWQATTSVSIGDLVKSGGRIWQANKNGATGSTAPTEIPGTTRGSMFTTPVVDGSTEWLFVCSASLAALLQDSYAYSVSAGDSEFIGGAYGFLKRDSVNVSGSEPKWFNSANMETDHTLFDGVRLEAGKNFYADQGWWGSSLSGNGFVQKSGHSGVSIDGTRIYGNWYHGMLIEGSGIRLSGVESAVNSVADGAGPTFGSYHGIAFASSARRARVTGCQSGWDPDGYGRQGYGLFFAATSDYWIATGNILINNDTGGFSGDVNGTTRIAADNMT